MAPLPARGRVFRHRRRVGLGDVSPSGRLRFDAVARYVQDVSNEDTRDASLDDPMAWVVRRAVVDVRRPAGFGEMVELATFCGAIGSRWAERRVTITGDDGADIDAATVWVHLDVASQRPKRLPEQFHRLFAEAAGGRTVRARLHLPETPPQAVDGPAGAVTRHPWPLRFCDFDVIGHLNNAAYWEALAEQLARRTVVRAQMRATVEFHRQIPPHTSVDVTVSDSDSAVNIWLTDATTGALLAAAGAWSLPP
ncbi:hypothetical protein BH18ACT4_BH18ACT4_08070 [soil metagenome]